MAESLSMLFRYSISRPGEMATLKDELDNVKNYLVIQGYRFPGKFKYQQRIEDEELLQYKLPVLTIQPVIENAIHHGLETKVGGDRSVCTPIVHRNALLSALPTTEWA